MFDAHGRVELVGFKVFQLNRDVEGGNALSVSRYEVQHWRVGFAGGMKQGVDFSSFVEQGRNFHCSVPFVIDNNDPVPVMCGQKVSFCAAMT